MKKYLAERLRAALTAAGYDGAAPLVFEKPKIEAHGDISTTIAMALAKSAKKNPRAVAQDIVSKLDVDSALVSAVEIAGPGFINFRLTPLFYTRELETIAKSAASYGRSDLGKGRKTQVEFVSANPTGPLSVGHGRQAALGDTIANLLEWTGHDVTREYYYNNAGRQMQVLALSTYARWRQLSEPEYAFPEDGYQGEYLSEIARKLNAAHGGTLAAMVEKEALEFCKSFAEERLFEAIRNVCAKMGVTFDVFYNEDSLYRDGHITEVIEELRKQNLVYEKDSALWFKSTSFGLEKDRVIVKSTGEPTYRLPDIAYHREKFRRGFELIVNILGADHIATVPDVLAGVKALGYDTEKIKVVIHQFVTLYSNGQQVKMSKRLANFVTLDELLDEVGSDAARFFFLMRTPQTHLEFDLDLAKEQSEKNPVYYVQYAHARIAGILRFARSQGYEPGHVSSSSVNFGLLKEESELALVKFLLEFPEQVEAACVNYEPHRICNYLGEAATAFHKFYHDHRVISELRELSEARLGLCFAAKTVIANGCAILGISAPDSM